ncbi:hypothetical protein GCM10009611_20280 [Arthrobacter roseus]
MAVMPEVVRVLCGLAGYGAALLYAGVGSTALLAWSGIPTLRMSVVVFSLIWAVALALWATAVLRSSRRSWPTFAKILVPVAVTVTLGATLKSAMFAPLGERSLDITALCAVALGLIILACRGYLQRRPTTSSADVGRSDAPAGRLLLGLAAASVLVAAVATPGLAASTAGEFAVPHSEHGQNLQPVLPEPGHHH